MSDMVIYVGMITGQGCQGGRACGRMEPIRQKTRSKGSYNVLSVDKLSLELVGSTALLLSGASPAVSEEGIIELATVPLAA